MRLSLPTDATELGCYVPRLIALAGEILWEKRTRQLGADLKRSPSQQKIMMDYHWLELFLCDHAASIAQHGKPCLPLMPDDVAVLGFAAMAVEVYERLSPRGQNALQGRLRSALSAETGFAALFLEFDMAQRLFNAGNDVEFPDLEGVAQHDLLFRNEHASGEVECKSLSADAGRKIHRKDFYRFVESMEPTLLRHAENGEGDIVAIRLDDRLPTAASQQNALRAATMAMLANPGMTIFNGSFFSLQRHDFMKTLGTAPRSSHAEFSATFRKVFGENAHVSGVVRDKGQCLIAMFSALEDDTSKPWLQAMEKASSQFSGTRPGFIAVQFNDIEPADLIKPHFRRRATILSAAVFRKADASHVAATFICPYRGLVQTTDGVGSPAFSILNPELRFSIDAAHYPVFLGSMSDQEFSSLVRE